MLTEAATILAAAFQLAGDSGEEKNPPASGRFRAEARSEAVYRGSSGSLEVDSPFLTDAEIKLDGRLDEEVWGRGALPRRRSRIGVSRVFGESKGTASRSLGPRSQEILRTLWPSPGSSQGSED